MVLASMPTVAHQELYHNIAINLKDTDAKGTIEVTFTLHAPELLVGFEEAGDAFFDERWLGTLNNEELKQLIATARTYLTHRFELRLGDDEVDLSPSLKFPAFTEIQKGEGVPPACFEARLTLHPAGSSELTVNHSSESEKRLLLVVTRPGSFPAVSDLPPGQNAVLPLPATEPAKNEPVPTLTAEAKERNHTIPFIGAAIFAALLIGIALLKKKPRMKQ